MKTYEQPFLWKLNWNLLRIFVVVVEKESITEAAVFLGVSQPTVSTAIKKLEASATTILLDRRPGHFRLTPAGNALYHEAREIFQRVTNIPAKMAAAEEEVSGKISIALTTHVVSKPLDDELTAFNIAYPNVRYALSLSDSSEVVHKVKNNQVTVGFCLLDKAYEDIEYKILYRQRFGLYCGVEHRLFNKTQISLSDLKGEASVSFQTELEDGPLHKVRRLREITGLHLEPKAVSSSLGEIRRLLVAGIGIGALPVHVAERDIKLGLLRPLPPFDEQPYVNLYMIINKKRNFNPAEEIFIEALNSMLSSISLIERTV